MANARSLDGLIKWLARDEWQDQFAEVFDRHLQPACDAADVEAEEVVSILGQDWFMTTVWGSAFEDFLTRELDDGRNIVDDYLKRRSWKESASARAYMSALRTSVVSLYEVSEIVRDTSFRARDLVRGGDPVVISEHSATRSLNQWDRIATRVIRLGSQNHISGAVLPFERDASENVLKMLRNLKKRTERGKRQLADMVARDVNDSIIVDAFSETALLRAAAPMITTVWLTEIIERALAPQALEVRNTEGDELVFCTVHFPFAADVTADDIWLVLSHQPELRQETETFWNWIETQKSTDVSSRKQSGPGNFQTFATTLDDGSLVLGNVELKEKTLVLSVNSKARAERGRALLAQILNGLVAQPLVEMETLEKATASRNASSPPSVELSEEERRTIVHRSLDRHYRDLLDQPVPMLGNVSPRTASRTSKGRARVVDWIKMLENHSSKLADRNDLVATYDFDWLWTELRVGELRK
jgi:hypothetical protein